AVLPRGLFDTACQGYEQLAEASASVADDLVIVIALVTIDGPGGTLATSDWLVRRAYGGAAAGRLGEGLPCAGYILLDVEDEATLAGGSGGAAASIVWQDLLAHEMAHVLGF